MIPKIIRFTTSDDIKPFLKPIWLFFGLLTLVGLFNINVNYSNFIDFSIFLNILFFWILMNHEHQDPLVLEKGMLSFALGSVALALLFNAGIGIEYSTAGRVSIFGDNENNTGIRVCISMLILILVIVQNRLQIGKIRYLLLLPIPVMLKLMTQTGSRIAIISFLLAFITGGVLLRTKKVWGKIVSITIVVLAIIFIGQYVMQDDVIRLRLLQSIQEGDLSGRDVIWERLLPLIKDNPIFGVGKTGYAHYAQSTFGAVESPHNVLLEVLCLTGITGLIIFLIFIYRIVKRSYQNYKTEGLMLQLLLIFPILGMLLSSHILQVKIGWAMFAYIAGFSNLNQKQEK